MRIIYPLLWGRPGRQACREQTVNTVAALARLGHEVTLLMPRRANDPAVTPADLRAYYEVEGDFDLIQHSALWFGAGALPSAIWLRRALAHPQTQRSDVLMSRIPAMLALGGASPAPFVTDHYRPWPDALPALRPFIRHTMKNPRCLGLIAHSQLAAESYRGLGVDPAMLLVAHNGADESRMQPALEREAARTALGLEQDRAIVVYAGRVNRRKGLDEVLTLADRRPEILFLLVGSEGDGPIEREAARRPNVRIAPWQTPRALPSYLYAADVLIVPPSRAPLERFGECVLPLKLFSYLAAGRPIMAPALPDTAGFLRHEQNALLVPAGEPDMAAEGLDRILNEPDLARRLATNARTLAATLTWEARAVRITDFLSRRLAALP